MCLGGREEVVRKDLGVRVFQKRTGLGRDGGGGVRLMRSLRRVMRVLERSKVVKNVEVVVFNLVMS